VSPDHGAKSLEATPPSVRQVCGGAGSPGHTIKGQCWLCEYVYEATNLAEVEELARLDVAGDQDLDLYREGHDVCSGSR